MQVQKFIVLFFSLVMFLYADFDEKTAHDLSKYLGDALQKNLGNREKREDTILQLEHVFSPKNIKIQLSQRSQRDTLFSVSILQEHSLTIKAFVLHPEEKEIVKQAIYTFFPDSKYNWYFSVGPLAWGVIKHPFADVYVSPINESGDNLATQLVYGHTVSILETTEDNSFFRIQGDTDKYLGWVTAKDIEMITLSQWILWTSKPPIYNKVDLTIQKKQIPTGSRFALHRENGNIVVVEDYKGNLHTFPSESFSKNIMDIVSTAKQFLPNNPLATKEYLWGGTTASKLDCSGFVQLTYRLNNVLLPRDADQQFQYSEKVALKDVQPGDLIFFSRNGLRPTHVGIHLDKNLFIHCSASGLYSGVKINNLEGENDYEKSLRKIYYGSGRIRKK